MIVFYDASCPLCAKEMQLLKAADKHNKIVLEDINAANFEQRFSHLTRQATMAFLHGQQDNGEMIYGLDVTIAAWQIVGRHKWLKLLQLPGIHYLARQSYKVFAKYRKPIARLMCKSSCGVK